MKTPMTLPRSKLRSRNMSITTMPTQNLYLDCFDRCNPKKGGTRAASVRISALIFAAAGRPAAAQQDILRDL